MEVISWVVLLVLTYYMFIWLLGRSRGIGNDDEKKLPLPPGPSPLPIIGNLLELGNKPHKSLAKLSKIYGPIMRLQLGQVTTIVVSSSDMAKAILQTYDHLLSNRTVPDSMTALNHHHYSLPFMSVSPRWRSLRKICNNYLFANKVLDATQQARRHQIQRLLSDIHQNCVNAEAVDVGKAAFKTTINLLSNTIYSVDLVQSVGKAGEFKETVTNIMKEVGRPNITDYFPLLKKIDPLGIRKRAAIHFAKLFDVFDHLISQRLQLRQTTTSSSTHNDILDALLNISDQDNQEMDPEKIRRLSFDLFAAGSDTTTSTLEWGMAELLGNPKIMSKAKAELEEKVGKGKAVEESDIGRLPYLGAIIKETFRMHPAVPFLLPRKAEKEVELGGYIIPKGAQVLVNVWSICRDPSIWENPDVFWPERFLGSEIDVKGRDFELTPFGAGRRICPGYPLALRMLFLMLGSLINSFDWKLTGGMKPQDMDMDDQFGITLGKAQPVLAVPSTPRN